MTFLSTYALGLFLAALSPYLPLPPDTGRRKKIENNFLNHFPHPLTLTILISGPSILTMYKSSKTIYIFKISRPNDFTGEVCEVFSEEVLQITHTFEEKNKSEPNTF